MKTGELLKKANENLSECSINCAEKTFVNESEAKQFFVRLKTKITNINEWNEHSAMSSYKLFGTDGELSKDQIIYVGAFIRIALKASGKYDWVRVSGIVESANELIITVNPTFDPTAEKVDQNVISHFFTDASINNFCVIRQDLTTALYVIGLNEKQNTGETGHFLESIRNVAVNLATYLGIQNGEWEKFCHSFIGEN